MGAMGAPENPGHADLCLEGGQTAIAREIVNFFLIQELCARKTRLPPSTFRGAVILRQLLGFVRGRAVRTAGGSAGSSTALVPPFACGSGRSGAPGYIERA